jgi:hypothetical protein
MSKKKSQEKGNSFSFQLSEYPNLAKKFTAHKVRRTAYQQKL